MSYISFNQKDSEKGPIAIIKGGEYDNKFIYICDNDTKSEDKVPKGNIIESLGLDYFYELYNEVKTGYSRYKKKRGLLYDDLETLSKSLLKQDKGMLEGNANSIVLCKMYDRAIIDGANAISNAELLLEDDSVIEIMPPTIRIKDSKGKNSIAPTRACLNFSGPSGSGKTTLTAKFAKNYHKLFPKAPIYVFSELKEDPSLDVVKGMSRINIGENLIEEPINVEDLAGEAHKSSGGLPTSLVIFDDIDVIRNNAVKKEVYKIQDALLQIGRHYNIYIVSTGHMLLNYQKTRIMLTECPFVTFFPKAGCSWQIERFLKTYVGLDNKQIKKVMGLPSRWITIYKNYPMYIVYQHGIYLLNS